VVQDEAEIEMWKIRKVGHIARKTTIDRLRRLAMLVFPVFPAFDLAPHVFGAPRVRPLPVRYRPTAADVPSSLCPHPHFTNSS
jgi:hypothetical protein